MPEWTQVFLFGMALLFAFSAIGVPIAFSLALSAFIGLIVFRTPNVAFAGMKTVIFGGGFDISLLPIPLFILMASVLIAGGVTQRGYDAFTRLFAGFKAGLPVATNYMLAMFGALMGSSAAAIGMVTQMGAPELKARGFSSSLIGGVIAGGSGLAVIIPPSILIILYSFVMQQGVIALFAAGIIPGILIAIGYSIWIIGYTWWKPPKTPVVARRTAPEPVAGGSGEKSESSLIADRALQFSEETLAALEGRISMRGRMKATVELFPMFVVAIGVLLAMFLGYASITEGAAVGVFGATLLTIIYRTTEVKGGSLRYGVTQTFRGIPWAIWNSIRVSGFIMFLIIGGRYFGQLFNLTGVTREFTVWITELPLSGIPLLLAIMGIFLFLGCVMETISIMLVLVPIAATALLQLGFDPIMLGILFVVNLEMALTTPPIGVNLFVLSGMARPYGITFEDVARGAIPFLVVDAIVLGIVIYNPFLATWLAGIVG